MNEAMIEGILLMHKDEYNCLTNMLDPQEEMTSRSAQWNILHNTKDIGMCSMQQAWLRLSCHHTPAAALTGLLKGE